MCQNMTDYTITIEELYENHVVYRNQQISNTWVLCDQTGSIPAFTIFLAQ
jgi:hypothetical protein